MLYDSLLIIALFFLTGFIWVPLSGDVVTGLAFQLTLLAEVIVFFGYCWGKQGETLGMRAWKIRIVNGDGALPQPTTNRPAFTHCAGITDLLRLRLRLGFFWARTNRRGMTRSAAPTSYIYRSASSLSARCDLTSTLSQRNRSTTGIKVILCPFSDCIGQACRSDDFAGKPLPASRVF